MDNDLFSPQLYPKQEVPLPTSTLQKEKPQEKDSPCLEKEDLFTVSTLTEAIKQNLESNYKNVRVEGEVSNFKLHSSGHWYFSLKDRDAQLSCALFRASAAKIKSPPKDGDAVVATGKISLFAPRGQYQLIATSLEKKGLGDLLAELERLKVTLKERGWFDKERKIALPTSPKVIGVVTSETGAALQDMINVLSHRNFSFHLLLFPVHVQGDIAAKEIAAAIRFFNKQKLCDVMIVGRGGGAYEDLMAFNDIAVLTAIHESHIPIISAVGHETDFTLSDFVADHRAPTPSAAAERVMASAKERVERLEGLKKQLELRVSHRMHSFNNQLEKLSENAIFRDPFSLIQAKWQAVDYARERIESKMTSALSQKKMQFFSASKSLAMLDPRVIYKRQKNLLEISKRRFSLLSKTLLQIKKAQFDRADAKLQALSPRQVLQRGYTMTYSENSPVTRASQLQKGKDLCIYFSDGTAEAKVEKIQIHSDHFPR